jgi:Tol biopolymer transport system component/DNA-binding winged helix-turn-helix (wHTH) protein
MTPTIASKSFVFRFADVTVREREFALVRAGQVQQVEPKAFRVLLMLLRNPNKLIAKEELLTGVWGDTAVTENSLARNIALLRRLLGDDPREPRFIETVSSIGYRFLCPVEAGEEPAGNPDLTPSEDLPNGHQPANGQAGPGVDVSAPQSSAKVVTVRPEAILAVPQTEAPGTAAPVNPASTEEPARPGSQSSRSRSVVIVALTAAAVLATAIAITTVAWLRQPRKPTSQEARHITSFGSQPALSRDGKLLAYIASVGNGPQQIWLQQTAGHEAIPVTTGTNWKSAPDFSPDGTHIAFYSAGEGAGIYIAPTLPGEPRLVTGTDYGYLENPRFSPSGDTILYLQDQKAFTVSVDGGPPVSLPLNQSFRLHSQPIWAPNGKEILFYGVRSHLQNEPDDWWIAPVAPGHPRLAHIPGAEQNNPPADAVRAWVRSDDGREWIIYSTASPESWKLWRIRVSSRGAIDAKPEQVASGNGKLRPGGSASGDGKLAYSSWGFSVSIYQISTSDRGQKLGPTLQLPFPEGGVNSSPSVSRDGKWMAYDTSYPATANTIRLRDLSTGTDHILDDKGRRPGSSEAASISPDGSRVIFERDCKAGSFPEDPAHPFPCGFMVAAAGGEPEQVCERCTPRGFSSDGSVILLQKYDPTDPFKDHIAALDLRTRTEKEFLSLPGHPLYHPFLSWDDRWVAFKEFTDPAQMRVQIMIAPVQHGSAAKQAEWITVTDGRSYDDKPQFSADGNTLYFTSARDGYLCIWAQRLDPATKHPLGPPFAFEHFHNSAGRGGTNFWQVSSADLSVARDKILINLPEVNSADIWMTQMQ